jgi:hypothetical protein
MGLFAKDNLFLPVAKRKYYIEYELPSSGKGLMVNFAWLEICMRNYASQAQKGIWLQDHPISCISLATSFSGVNEKIAQKIDGLSEKILIKTEIEPSEKLLQAMEVQLKIGAGLAYVEHFSKFMIEGLVHPSIHNAMSAAKVRDLPENMSNVGHALDKAVEIGYGVTRFWQEPIDKFLKDIRKLLG